jgi:hypothetical protein
MEKLRSAIQGNFLEKREVSLPELARVPTCTARTRHRGTHWR